MKTVTKYQSSDGHLFDDPTQCQRRDVLIATVTAVTSLLNPRPKDGCSFENGGGYILQDLTTVEAVKNSLIDLWEVDEGVKAKARQHPASHSILVRFFDDAQSPLRDGWYRLLCIDTQGQEWGQPYYAAHPSKGKDVCLN